MNKPEWVKGFEVKIPEGMANKCMFCGHDDFVIEHECLETNVHAFKVSCIYCGASGPIMTGETKEEGMFRALSRWNKGYIPSDS